MTKGVRKLELGELALVLSVQQGAAAYLACVVPSEATDAARELQDELESLGIPSSAAEPLGASELVAKSGEVAASILLVDGRHLNFQDWLDLDRRRSELQRTMPLVLFVTSDGLDELMRDAPHLSSWLGADVYEATGQGRVEDMEHDREHRLQALREWSGSTDDEVVERAKNQTLPRDPEYGEWLVLLGRGDLISE